MKKLLLGLAFSSAVLMAGDISSGINYLNSGDEQKAFMEFQKLAKSGDIDAATMLGEMYLDGIGVEQDNKKAYYWIQKAANAGDKEAEYLLGFMYENGIEVKEDIAQAVIWYEKAANKGDIMAMYNLAFIYKNGANGVKKDLQKAVMLMSEVEEMKDGV
jgi:TPR repeat protein